MGGHWLLFEVFRPPDGPNNEGIPSSAPADGGDGGLGSSPLDRNYLHVNPYPNTAAPGQPQECEAGNEPYMAGPAGDRQRPRQPGHRHGGPAVSPSSRAGGEPVQAGVPADRRPTSGSGAAITAGRRRGSSGC